MNVVVLGGSGMLGVMLAEVLSRNPLFHVLATVRYPAVVDRLKVVVPLAHWQAVGDVAWGSFDSLGRLKWDIELTEKDWLINAIGITNRFLRDEQDSKAMEEAVLINSLFPFVLQRSFPRQHIIHISTDCLFAGSGGPYTEKYRHDVVDAYGKSKSLGEVLAPNVAVLRTSIVGPESGRSRSLLEWFLAQPLGGTVQGFTNHIWNGLTTYQFAKICEGMILNDTRLAGVQHIVPRDTITKYGLLQLFAKYFYREDVEILPVAPKERVDRVLGTNNRTVNERLWRQAGYPELPSIEDMIKELARDRGIQKIRGNV